MIYRQKWLSVSWNQLSFVCCIVMLWSVLFGGDCNLERIVVVIFVDGVVVGEVFVVC